MGTDTFEGSSIWADEAVLRLIRIWVDKNIQQQLDICSQRPIYKKMAKLWLHPFILVSMKVEDSYSLSERK